jgi:hypothetical protein
MFELTVWFLTCVAAIGGSEVIFRKFITPKKLHLEVTLSENEMRLSRYIGKCENIFIVTTVMVEAYVAMALVIFSRQVMRTVSLRDTIRIVEDEEGEQGKYSEFRDVEDSTTIFSPYWPILHGAWL